MISINEAKIEAWLAISKLLGNRYFKENFEKACPTFSENEGNLMYFLGFEDDGVSWTVFAKVNVNRETKEVTFLDYRTPEGKRMENPISPISFVESD